MSTVDSIISVNITRNTTAVDRASFNIPMFLADFTVFSERAREYSSLTAVAADFPSTHNVYKAAQMVFGQQVKPPKLIVGRRQVNSVTGSVATVANSTLYSVTINGVVYSYMSDASATALEIVAGLDTAVGALAGINFTDNLDGTFTVGVSTPGTAWSIKASSNLTLTNVAPTETWVDALTAVELANSQWYVMGCESHVQADVVALAAAIEAKYKLFFTSTSDAACKTSGTTDVMAVLNTAGYARTSVLWSAEASKYPEMGWVGGQIVSTPGSNTWKFKSIAGIAYDTMSETETNNIKLKKGNTYERIGGVNIATEGTTAVGEFIDVMVLVDWMRARMQERVYFRLVNTAKLPYTRQGTAVIETEIRAVLEEAVANGGIASNPRYTVTVPDTVTAEPNLRALRTLPDIKFEARLAGAIHFVSIVGNVSV